MSKPPQYRFPEPPEPPEEPLGAFEEPLPPSYSPAPGSSNRPSNPLSEEEIIQAALDNLDDEMTGRIPRPPPRFEEYYQNILDSSPELKPGHPHYVTEGMARSLYLDVYGTPDNPKHPDLSPSSLSNPNNPNTLNNLPPSLLPSEEPPKPSPQQAVRRKTPPNQSAQQRPVSATVFSPEKPQSPRVTAAQTKTQSPAGQVYAPPEPDKTEDFPLPVEEQLKQAVGKIFPHDFSQFPELDPLEPAFEGHFKAVTPQQPTDLEFFDPYFTIAGVMREDFKGRADIERPSRSYVRTPPNLSKSYRGRISESEMPNPRGFPHPSRLPHFSQFDPQESETVALPPWPDWYYYEPRSPRSRRVRLKKSTLIRKLGYTARTGEGKFMMESYSIEYLTERVNQKTAEEQSNPVLQLQNPQTLAELYVRIFSANEYIDPRFRLSDEEIQKKVSAVFPHHKMTSSIYKVKRSRSHYNIGTLTGQYGVKPNRRSYAYRRLVNPETGYVEVYRVNGWGGVIARLL